ncbi:hypothetical protein BJY04DRAFT_179578 [Aspergillus karnatakaensis]|uniref:uncharacterized protein n=1 Tax=Aspergillus karnatakaensis TaxID=1810916 RepID=UPI003CCD4C01
MHFTNLLTTISLLSTGALAAALPSEADANTNSNSLTKRTDFSGANLICYPDHIWDRAGREAINNGIDYLRGVPGQPVAGPGPGACARVSCSYNSAIWWCNDDPAGKTLASFGSIADGARHISLNCNTGGFNGVLSGQVFHHTGWNVIVRKDVC